MIESTNKNLSLLFALIIGPIFIILVVISVYLIQPEVEEKLTSTVKRELAKHNITVEVSFSGRDGILKGEVDTQENMAKAQSISLAVFGTRTIRNYLNIQTKQDSCIQTAMIKKISYTTKQAERKITPNKNKLISTSQVDEIISNMQQLKKPIIHSVAKETAISTQVNKFKIKDKSVFNKPNELLHIINNFNSSLIAKENKRNIPKVSIVNTKKLAEIDLSTLRFSDTSTVLSKESYSVLNKISEAIKAQSFSYIELVAYAKDSNIGYARGVAIREYLATKGIPENIIHISGQTLLDSDNKKAIFEIRLAI